MTLEVDFLRHFEFPTEWTRRLRETIGERFLPIQEKAIQAAGFFEGKNFVIVGPTSCGKSLVGELALLRGIRRNRPGFLVVPTKALAGQRFEELQRRYAPLGLQVVHSSRDQRQWDGDIAEGKYHLAVIVTEKLLALLTRHPHLFARTGAIVIDEMQTLFDPDRGAGVELLLTRLVREEQLQIVGLSAVVEQPEQLAQWLEAELVEESERPMELRQGVLCPGQFHYRESNSGSRGVEPVPGVDGQDEEELLLAGVEHFAGLGQMTLLFCAGREESFRWAEQLRERINYPPAEEALEQLEALEDNLLTGSLRKWLAQGVAVHNSDLTRPQRKLVEQLAAAGQVRVLCSTSTLSEGVNLPIVNTFAPRHQYLTRLEDLERGRPPRVEPISRSDFQNMTGRSARLGWGQLPRDEKGQPFGRGMMVSPFSGDAEILLSEYFRKDSRQDIPQLFGSEFPVTLAQMVATGSVRTFEEALDFLSDSLSARAAYRAFPVDSEDVRQSLEKMQKQGLLELEEDRLEVTELGRVGARSGVLPGTLDGIRQWAESAEEIRPPELLLRLALSPDGARQYIPLKNREWKSRRYLHEFYRRLEEHQWHEDPWFGSVLHSSRSAGVEFSRALKKTLLLWDWMSGAPTVKLEGAYQVLCGSIEKLAEQFSWLVRTAADTGFVSGWEESLFQETGRLADSLQLGLPLKALGLVPLARRGLSRTALLRLAEEEVLTEEAVEDLPLPQVVEWLGRVEANKLIEAEHVPVGETAVPIQEAQENSADERTLSITEDRIEIPAPVSLVLERARPDRLLLGGKAVDLTGKEFDLMWELASAAGRCVSYDRLLSRVWPDVEVEQQQISSHKSRLLKKVRKVLGPGAPELIRTVRGRGLLLPVDTEKE